MFFCKTCHFVLFLLIYSVILFKRDVKDNLEPLMNLLIKVIPFLLLIGVCAPSYAAVNGVELTPRAVYGDSDSDGNDDKKTEEGDKKTEEEEPDCE